jgi:hypothetical protein
MLPRVGYEWLAVALEGLDGIEPHEVTQVLNPGHPRWPRPAVSDTGIRVLSVWGRTSAGRALIVAVRHIEGLDWLIVGARDMTDKEEDQFQEWEARHGH